MQWQPMSSARIDGKPFLAIYDDGEYHVCKLDEHGRVLRRSHQQRFPQSYRYDENGNQILIREDFVFDTDWSVWTRGYDANPTHWMPLPEPPEGT